jgi:hypothetical protein
MTISDPRADVGVPLKEYVDGQLVEVRRAAELALAASGGESVPLREYFDAIMREQQRAVAVAEQEREKAAKALRDELERTIQEGDRNLRDHIENQVLQIKAALVAAETLEVARIASAVELAEARFDAIVSEMRLVNAASEQAIAKAEASTERRFESVNEFRAQLAQQTSSFLPREVAEAQFSEIRRTLTELAEKLGKLA